MFIVFYESLLYAKKVEEDTKAIIFNSKKLRFLSHFYLKQVRFLCFFGLPLNFFVIDSLLERVHSFLYPFFHKPKALIFGGVLPLFCFLSSCTTKSLNFLCSWAFYTLRCILVSFLYHWVTFFFPFLFFRNPKF